MHVQTSACLSQTKIICLPMSFTLKENNITWLLPEHTWNYCIEIWERAHQVESFLNLIHFHSHLAYTFVSQQGLVSENKNFSIYSFTFQRKKNRHTDLFFFHSCQKIPNKTPVTFSLLLTLELSTGDAYLWDFSGSSE